MEVRDRRQRRKTIEVILAADPAHPASDVADDLRQFAVGATRRQWATVVARYGDDALNVALSLVRGRVVHLACRVDDRGGVSEPSWWKPTHQATTAAAAAHAQAAHMIDQRDVARLTLVDQLLPDFTGVAEALRRATASVAIAVISAAAADLLAGITHAGPRAFTQAHFDGTKAHDVRSVLTAAGIPEAILEQLGLRRGDRIGLGGPIVISTHAGVIDLAPLRGPVILRLDQPNLELSTKANTVVVIENLQPAEIVCARYPDLPVVYTAGQFGDDAASLLARLANSSKRLIAIVDADLGGVRIARRLIDVAPHAEILDVGSWKHPIRPRSQPVASQRLDCARSQRTRSSAGSHQRYSSADTPSSRKWQPSTSCNTLFGSTTSQTARRR